MKIQKALEFINKSKETLTSRKAKIFISFIGTSFLMLNMMPQVMAQVRVADTYEIEKEIQCNAIGVSGTSCPTSSADVTSNAMIAGATMMITTVAGSEATAANPSVISENTPTYVRSGLLGVVGGNIDQMISDPPSVNVYANLVSDWVPGETVSTSVYAADGYDLLQSTGIDDLWNAMRNIAYVLFVVVLIIAGFMMMFRQKIGGQVAVTIFNTIPQIILGLILVTFSFAIVGFMINVGALLTSVAAGILGLSSPDAGVVIHNPLSLFFAFITGDFATGGTNFNMATAGALVTTIVGSLLSSSVGVLTIPAIGVGLGAAAGVVAVVGFIGLLLFLAVLGIVLFASFKVFITLLKAYIGLLMDTVFAPILIAFSVIPGQSGMRNDWFKRVVKNTLTFPGVFFVINLATYIFTFNLDFSFPTDLAGGTVAGGGGTSAGMMVLMQGVVSIYLFFLAAEIPKMLDDFLPMGGGKGVAAGAQSAAKNAFGKLPVVGGAFG